MQPDLDFNFLDTPPSMGLELVDFSEMFGLSDADILVGDHSEPTQTSSGVIVNSDVSIDFDLDVKTDDIFKQFDFEAFDFDHVGDDLSNRSSDSNGSSPSFDSQGTSSPVSYSEPTGSASGRTCRELSSASENSFLLGNVLSPPETPLNSVSGLCLDLDHLDNQQQQHSQGIEPYQLSSVAGSLPVDFSLGAGAGAAGSFTGFNLDQFFPSSTGVAGVDILQPQFSVQSQKEVSRKRARDEIENFAQGDSETQSPKSTKQPKRLSKTSVASPAPGGRAKKTSSRIQALIKASNETEAARLVGVTTTELRDLTRFPTWESIFAVAPSSSHPALNKIRERQDVGRTQQREYAYQARVKKDNALVQVPLLEAEIDRLRGRLERVEKEREEMKGRFSKLVASVNAWFGGGRITVEEFSTAVL